MNLLESIQNFFSDVFSWLFSQVVDLLVYVLNTTIAFLPDLNVTEPLNQAISNVPGLLWVMDLMSFQTGVTLVASAFLVRFLLRALPFSF